MSRSVASALVLGALAVSGLAACPSHPPAPGVRTEPPVRIPPGCGQDLSGEYHHTENPAFHYRAQDDGHTLSLTLLRTRADGGVEQAPDPGAISLTLTRTPDGFVGVTHATGFNVSGSPCPVTFPTEITACGGDTLTLRTVPSTAIDEACQSPSSGPVPQRVEHVLRRSSPPSTDVPDAGPSDAGT
ncbi:hypothetical protein [Stigmatella aurantiaca]|uniref:Conserved uncharacterized protein n=1 Tax=Stigmatella aurantiaca (strain DW4/3-1) TaxID=378806 RepID=Q098M8_STIAD|nr:hypothetical protein [Stigmatella aurantiaca]ADO74161.1 conserved uncharacterized protein [Stigmatella aurantiaca DW4/3-1]EAU68197.1 hypothetical protein STIAU_7767 [Stigmatella aurantiaca DW4/3-1]